ncbi:MAG: hypothetical protein E6F93_01245 [Actinobacteria bacterium]|nr:MAG: hypothetical protein E6F93_01245 [Actinomycetota bacterium]
MATATKPSEAMIEALEANEPFPAYADELMLFGQLVGSWDVEVSFFDPEGNVIRERRGEWHFGWVLEGRVIQDVLISPPREGRDVGQASHEYGTTLRAYDPKIDAWRVTFVAPVFGATVNLIAREHGNEIWLEGRAPDNSLCRWTFSEITSERVRWQGFSSSDEGLTWTREEEMILHRRR